jgi:hypothetical protein
MRLSTSAVLSALGLSLVLTLTACVSGGESGSDNPAYDGSADSMDSLPDCGPDSQGAIFWVKDKSGAFECMKNQQWRKRSNAKKPDDDDETESEAQKTPRIVK